MADNDPTFEIDRSLQRIDPNTREPVIIAQGDITDVQGPIVILGDPGLGKSVLT